MHNASYARVQRQACDGQCTLRRDMSMPSLRATVCLTVSVAAFSACQPSTPLTVHFKPVVGLDDFSCAGQYALGTTHAFFTPKDFRLYLHDVAVLEASGKASPLTLKNDGRWQRDPVVMLDFEDGTHDCSNGTAAMNFSVTGDSPLPAKSVTALRFTLGLPFALNHVDGTAAAPPLDSSAMFWSWLGGYKFLRIDGKTQGQTPGFDVHLGSTGCQPGSAPNSVSSCRAPNLVTVTISPFDPDQDSVLVDLGALLEGSDLDHNTDGTAVGCESSPDDPECGPVFERLGLPFGTVAADPSKNVFFRRGP